MDIIHRKKEDIGTAANIPSPVGEEDLKPAVTEDAVFGVIEGDGPNYRNVYLCHADSYSLLRLIILS